MRTGHNGRWCSTWVVWHCEVVSGWGVIFINAGSELSLQIRGYWEGWKVVGTACGLTRIPLCSWHPLRSSDIHGIGFVIVSVCLIVVIDDLCRTKVKNLVVVPDIGREHTYYWEQMGQKLLYIFRVLICSPLLQFGVSLWGEDANYDVFVFMKNLAIWVGAETESKSV